MRILNISLFLLVAVSTAALHAEGFLELLYDDNSSVQDSLVGAETIDLLDGGGYGLVLGVDTSIFGSSFFFDLELGYEISEHQIDHPLATDAYYYTHHRVFLGARLKWDLEYVEIYVGGGLLPWAYYEASDAAAGDTGLFAGGTTPGASNYDMLEAGSGSYICYGIDFFISAGGNLALGIEQREFTYTAVDVDDDFETEAAVSRLSFKFLWFY